jgi:hypothetical protein
MELTTREQEPLTAKERDRSSKLSRLYPNTYDACLENTQDAGYEPWSPDETREVIRQVEGLADAGEAS